MLFTGQYEHNLDAKHRLAIPSDIRAALDPARHGTGFYLAPGPNDAPWLWPQRIFEAMSGALEQSLLPTEEQMLYEQLLFSQATHLEIDSTNRIRLPQRLVDHFKLGPSIMILGVKDHLELHNPATWQQQLDKQLGQQKSIMLRAREALRQQQPDSKTGS